GWCTGVSPNALAGAFFGAVSFATVLPAVRLGLAILGEPGAMQTRLARPVTLAAIGFGMLALALAFPRYAFPLAWLFLWPLCEAAAALLEPRTLAPRLEPRVFWRLAVLGSRSGPRWVPLTWQCDRR